MVEYKKCKNSVGDKSNNGEILNEFSQFIKSFLDPNEERLPQRAYYFLRHAIRNLILPPGRTILERELGEVLEMSRTPVREALVRLEAEEALKIIPRRGFIVEPIETDDLNEVYQIVGALEGLAIELASRKISERQVNELECIVLKQEEALGNSNIKEWAILDDVYHSKMIEFAGNHNLSKVIETYSDKLYRARLYTINYRPIPLHSVVEHKAMIACLRADDGKAARHVMESHRSRARQEILHALDKISHNES